jgi:hypothetical protein
VKKVFVTAAVAALLSTAGVGFAQSKAGDSGSNGNRGLCNAYQRGSETGQQHKRENGQSFLRLAQTAGDYNQDGTTDSNDVIQYCAENVPAVGGGQ